VAYEGNLNSKVLSAVNGDGCSCSDYTCLCCAAIDISKIHLVGNGCVNVTYVPAEVAFDVTLLIDGSVKFTKEISLDNPQVCIPYEVAELCVQFLNVTLTESDVAACVYVEAMLFKEKIADVKLGCFNETI